jgi:PKHD-type hydroxylase
MRDSSEVLFKPIVMTFQILQILEADEIEAILADLDRQTFVDGKLTASGIAKAVKNNLQVGAADLDGEQPDTELIDEIVMNALWRSEVFQAFALPRRIIAPLFARYEPGMSYGSHVDVAIMGPDADPVRSDLAMTIFLSEPEACQGGELVLEMPFGKQEIKLPAGQAVIYSANSLHRVNPVASGVRLVAVTWIQSLVRDENLRTILFDLSEAARRAEELADAGLTATLNKCCHNLLRYAAEI